MEGRFNGGFFCVTALGGLYLEGFIHGGAYFRNFTVSQIGILKVNLQPSEEDPITTLLIYKKNILHKSKYRRPKFPTGTMFKKINVHTVLSVLV